LSLWASAGAAIDKAASKTRPAAQAFLSLMTGRVMAVIPDDPEAEVPLTSCIICA
jgi:hypothetical protein